MCSVFFQGSRFGDVRGYREDATLDPVYAARMGRIIEAANARSMVVLVGCLYWSTSRAKWANWTQTDAVHAIANTVRWLQQQLSSTNHLCQPSSLRAFVVPVAHDISGNFNLCHGWPRLVISHSPFPPNFKMDRSLFTRLLLHRQLTFAALEDC